ncbi:hypothetical protein LDENG_00082270 [Lucifuga dentata]|nr:hypothetical protein LDENG_00082270 [Lucifuga dentata]
MLRVQGRRKKISRAAESAQFCCSRHSEVSGEPRRKEGKEGENNAILLEGLCRTGSELDNPGGWWTWT